MTPLSLLNYPTGEPSGAVISRDLRYRYALERRWNGGPFVMFVMLNPSTADEREDDATIRRCVGFAKRWGYGGILVGNLYAYRTTNSNFLRLVEKARGERYAVGPDCDVWLQTMVTRSTMIVAAWGAHPLVPQRSHVLVELAHGKPLMCLGRTRAGYPLHPVRLPYATELERWP